MHKTQQAGVYQDLMSSEMIAALSNPETPNPKGGRYRKNDTGVRGEERVWW